MAKPIDTRCMPGDIVTIRGISGSQLFTLVGDPPTAQGTGYAPINSLGMVLAVRPPSHPHLSYVIFSSSIGWVSDGQLRKL